MQQKNTRVGTATSKEIAYFSTYTKKYISFLRKQFVSIFINKTQINMKFFSYLHI